MPACLTCGFNEFGCYGGLYFCGECGTQFTDHRKEEQDDEYVATNISSTSEIKTARTPKTKEVAKPSRAWLTTEAFNIILCRQVHALLQLGASPNLKATVLQLWAYYLQKCEVCFKKNVKGDNWIPSLGLSPRRRDVQILCGAKEITSSRKRKKKHRKSSSFKRVKKNASNDCNSSVNKTSNSADMSEIAENSACSEVIDDLSVSTCFDLEFPERTPSSCKRSLFCKKKRKELGAKAIKNLSHCVKKRLPDYMILSKTLSFCYLGLLLTRDKLLVSDIIRFAKDGYIPYMDAITVLPSDMMRKDCDWQMLSPSVLPTMNEIISASTHLAKYLNLPKLEHTPLLPIAARFIKDFNLPHSFINYVHNVISKVTYPDYWYPSDSRKKKCSKIMFYEVKALASIIVVLKLLFGLNGKSEIEHSKIIKKINSLCSDSNLFIWEDWYFCLRLKADFLKNRHMSYTQIAETLDVESLALYYCTTIKKWTPSNKPSNKDKAFDPDFRSSLRTVLSSAVLKKNFRDVLQPPSCFPLSSKICHEIGIAKSSLLYSASPFFDWNILKKDFSQSSVHYSSHHHKKNSVLTAKILKLFSKLKKKFYTKNNNKKMDSSLKTDLHNSYWYLRCTRRNINSAYESIPLTFKWLIDFTSDYIGCNAQDLLYEIWTIEKNVFKLK